MTPQTAAAKRIRWGILALPISSVLILAANLIRPSPPESLPDARAAAEYFSSSRLALGDAVGSVGSLLTIFAFFALYAYLANGRAERWAFYAMVLCVPGLTASITLSLQGDSDAFLANLYLEGQQAAWEQVWTASMDLSAYLSWGSLYIMLTNFVLLTAGLVLFAVAIWRSQTLPQGAAVLWLAYGVLFLAATLTPWTIPISDLLFLVASAWIAWVVLRQPSVGVGEAEAQPRVR
jgi:hypothetical protein